MLSLEQAPTTLVLVDRPNDFLMLLSFQLITNPTIFYEIYPVHIYLLSVKC